jgi:hypothetical protein
MLDLRYLKIKDSGEDIEAKKSDMWDNLETSLLLCQVKLVARDLFPFEIHLDKFF